MKAMIVSDFAVLRSAILQLLGICAIIALFMGYAMGTLVGGAAAIAAMPPFMLLFSLAATDEQNGWERFRLTLPLTRRQVVFGRYASLALVAIGTIVFALALSFLLLGVISCMPAGTLPEGLTPAENPPAALVGSVVGAVGVITLDGTIQYDGTTSSPEGLKSQLDAAEQNPHIKAVVLRVNSGGGVATAGEEMSTYIRDFSKPVVVSSASINASAAYMISSQADYIFTDKTTSIGSIGVIMSVTDLSGLYEKLGISVENITSADAKDSGAGNRPLTEEERAWYQDQVDQINEVFINFVAEGRDMPVEDVRALATGLTFTGMDAVENGLADELGTQEAAVAKACELAGIADADTVYLQSSTSDLSRLLDIMGTEDSLDVSGTLKELENRVGLE